MKRSLWLNAALAAAVAALALFVYLKPPSDADYRLSTLPAAAVKRIELQIRGRPPVVLERKESDWHMTAPHAVRADAFQVQALLAALGASSRERYPATGLARFDLNEPYARLALNDEVFGFGAVNEMTREQYVMSGNNVYLIALRYGAALPKDALQLASRQLFAANEAPTVFEFPDFSLAQRDGHWQSTPAQTAASEDDYQRWVDEWRLATASQVTAAPEEKPLMTVSVRRKDGSSLRLAVLQREPELVLVRPDEKLAYRFPPAVGRRLLTPPASKNAK
jgi:hypothetical protein